MVFAGIKIMSLHVLNTTWVPLLTTNGGRIIRYNRRFTRFGNSFGPFRRKVTISTSITIRAFKYCTNFVATRKTNVNFSVFSSVKKKKKTHSYSVNNFLRGERIDISPYHAAPGKFKIATTSR